MVYCKAYTCSVVCVCVCLLQGHKRQARKKTTKSFEMHAVWHFLGDGNTWAYSDLPAVDIINLIHKPAAAMWPLATNFIATCLLCCFSGTVYTAV